MATIGTFTASDNGYTGMIKTVTLSIKARFAASAKDNDKAPDYRVFAGAIEFGAAGRRPPAAATGNISRSSSTIRASRLRSTRHWSGSKVKKSTA